MKKARGKVLIIDTSILCVWLRVPGKESCGPDGDKWDWDRVEEKIKVENRNHSTFVLPLATIIETGNHISQAKHSRQDRGGSLAGFTSKSADQKSPWAAFSDQAVLWTSAKLKELANVNVPEARQIVVTPFDGNNVHAIRKGIEAANLGITPLVDGKVVRINIPPMDESIRKQIAKQCKELGEKAKISMREIRRRFNELVRKQKADGILPEDMMKKAEKIIKEAKNLLKS